MPWLNAGSVGDAYRLLRWTPEPHGYGRTFLDCLYVIFSYSQGRAPCFGQKWTNSVARLKVQVRSAVASARWPILWFCTESVTLRGNFLSQQVLELWKHANTDPSPSRQTRQPKRCRRTTKTNHHETSQMFLLLGICNQLPDHGSAKLLALPCFALRKALHNIILKMQRWELSWGTDRCRLSHAKRLTANGPQNLAPLYL